METMDLLRMRHSVRQFEEKPIDDDKRKAILDLIAKVNREHKTNIQVFFNEPTAFSTFMAHYGKFENANNYLALVGQKEDAEKLGFYGEMVLLEIYRLGLAGCWVALTYGKGKVRIDKKQGEKLHCVICFGYGKNQGVAHRGKLAEQVIAKNSKVPAYAENGIEASLLAPTAVNQQKFEISFVGEESIIKTNGTGFYTDIDLGIVKYHFELATGHKTNRDY